MGEHDKVRQDSDPEELRLFTKALLSDLRALEKMLAEGVIESGRRRLGAEQETVLVDDDWRPAPVNLKILERLADKRFTTELGRFNIEYNLDPIDAGGDCLTRLERQLEELLAKGQEAARQEGATMLLTGILPTLTQSDLTLANMTPVPRYQALNDAMSKLRGDRFHLRIKGRDELIIDHDNVMLEACTTSFQLHYQVSADEFAHLYNIAQVLAAPVLACATNSPLLFGRLLWRETRIALFQQSVDTRGQTDSIRDVEPRVSFGRSWVRRSALEIFQEDLARFRVLLGGRVTEDPFAVLAAGGTPDLTALRVHNSTVYRWNRPCYGISDGKPHLRIENRVLPSGPSIVDEVANAALWYGLMSGAGSRWGDVTERMEFAMARENFVAAARRGMGADLYWLHGDHVPAPDLLRDELLPLARQGLEDLEVDGADIDRYLGVIAERVDSQRSGSQWQVTSLDAMGDCARHEGLAALVAASCERQAQGQPAHTWPLAKREEAGDARKHFRRIDQLMTTDLFTVNQDELVDMAAYVMHWKHIRHVPVEDNQHRLVGLVTHRSLLRLVPTLKQPERSAVPISEIMQTKLHTVHPHTPTQEAFRLMRRNRISCLPVVDEEYRLVGIVTETDFMELAADLVDKFLAGEHD